MNKKIVYATIALITAIITGIVFALCSPKTASQEIYFFTKEGCPYCQYAQKYIETKHPTLSVKYKDISTRDNFNLFVKLAKQHKLDLNQLGTPLIFVGQNHILGWSTQSEKDFDKYLASINKETK